MTFTSARSKCYSFRTLWLRALGHVLAATSLWLALVGSGWAQTIAPVLDLATPNSALAAYQALPLRAVAGLPANSTPEQALAAAALAPAFDPERVYALSPDTALWLTLRVRTDATSQTRWVLNFVNTFLDRVELHAINAQGSWQREMAGDNIAHAKWTHRTLAPQVLLPIMATGERDVLIKIVHGFPQQIPIKLMTQADADQSSRDAFLLAGLLIGVLGVIFLLSLHLAVSYRDVAYAWYAVYMLLAILAVASYLGMASYLLWPGAESWPEYSVLFLILASLAAQLWFCQMMFLRGSEFQSLRRSAMAVVGICSVIAVVFFFVPTAQDRIVIFVMGMVMSVGTIVLIVGLTIWRTRQRAAYFWVLAYVPLLCAVVVTLMRHFSWITSFNLPFELPVYPLVFEALVLLAALHLHAKDGHALQERARALAALDPLTGFLNSSTFSKQLQQLWQRSLLQRQDISLALIQLQHSTDRSDSQSALKLERKMLRSVRLLRAIMRDVDVVGRIGGNTLAVAMPGIPMGDDLNNRLSRLVAQGLMHDPYDADATELRFRIAAGSRMAFGNNLSAFDNTLRGEISQSLGWSRKPIHYITPVTSPGELPFEGWAAKPDSALATPERAEQKLPRSQNSSSAPDSAAMSSGASSRPVSSQPQSK